MYVINVISVINAINVYMYVCMYVCMQCMYVM